MSAFSLCLSPCHSLARKAKKSERRREGKGNAQAMQLHSSDRAKPQDYFFGRHDFGERKRKEE